MDMYLNYINEMKCLPGIVCLLVIIYYLKAFERELIQELLNSENNLMYLECDSMICQFQYLGNEGRHNLNDVNKREAFANYPKY